MSVTRGYDYEQPIGQAGQIADLGPRYVRTRVAEGAIAFGRALATGTASPQVVVMSDVGEEFEGVALFTHNRENQLYDSNLGYIDKDAVNVLRQGRVYVEVTDDVADGDTAYVDVTNGKFTNTDNAGANPEVPTGRFTMSASAGGLSILEINLP